MKCGVDRGLKSRGKRSDLIIITTHFLLLLSLIVNLRYFLAPLTFFWCKYFYVELDKIISAALCWLLNLHGK